MNNCRLIGNTLIMLLILLVSIGYAESIHDVQYTTIQGEDDDCFPSLIEGETVTLEGVVTGVKQGDYPDFFLQHPDSSEWYGVFIYEADVSPRKGDWIVLTGIVNENYGLTEIKDLSGWEITAQHYPLPEPVWLRTSYIAGGCNFDTERYEGVLVELRDIDVLTDPNSYGEFWVTDDGIDSCMVDDELYRFGANQPHPPPAAGMHYERLVGLVTYTYGEYRLLPRGAEDFNIEIPQMYCDVWPHYPPVEIPANGAVMTMDGLLHNFADTIMIVDVWADAIWVTGGIRYENIQGCCQYRAFPGSNVYPYSCFVPRYIQSGEWIFRAYAGLTDEGVVYDSGHFSFRKLHNGRAVRIPNQTISDYDSSGADYERPRSESGWIWYDGPGMVGYDDVMPIEMPMDYGLRSYPNPFNPTTEIRFELREDSKVTLNVYNIAGRKVANLVDSYLTRGVHNVTFKGSSMSSGVYFYRLETKNNSVTKRMILLK
ncbi:MAG: T9SS type A sorting domain-containing protein [candidate division Zixibacteria bacterium]|nr:T9SS type A sorting domain-containing protein [candidate division Zixibacteria bacterium]